MKIRFVWLVLGVVFILSSVAITLVEFNHFSGRPSVFPTGSTIASLPVGGLTPAEAQERLVVFFSLPLVLDIEGATVHADPVELGFSFDPEVLIAEAMDQLDTGNFWGYLWGNTSNHDPIDVPFTAAVDEILILDYLTETIQPRYTQPELPHRPVAWTTNFIPGEPGQQLEKDRAVAEIRAALLSPETHNASIQIVESGQVETRKDILQAFLRHNINWSGFDDLVEIYLESMATGESLHFAVQRGELIEPDVAYTAASTIKIPIMISVLRRTPEPTPETVVSLLEQMIALSENPPADTLMSNYIDEVRGPLMVSEDLAALGMENTFLAGYFYLGAPLLQRYETPANNRTDIFLNPDIYNQVVPSEIGQLLAAIYNCADDGSGLLTETFPGEITREKCQLMIDILAGNQIGLLIEAGVSYQATVAHKHGWVTDLDGLIRFMSDVGIVFSPGGDFVLNVFIHDAVRLNFDQGNRVIARIAQTVYNFYNLEEQAHWWFD